MLENEIIGKWFENGDALVNVLSVILCDNGAMAIICLKYSSHHNCYSIDKYSESDFNQYFLGNEKEWCLEWTGYPNFDSL